VLRTAVQQLELPLHIRNNLGSNLGPYSG